MIKIKSKKKTYSQNIMDKLVGFPCKTCGDDQWFTDSKELMIHEQQMHISNYSFSHGSLSSFAFSSASNLPHPIVAGTHIYGYTNFYSTGRGT